MDLLSDALRTIRLQGAFFVNGEFHAPWCVVAPNSGELAYLLMPGARRLAICHFVLEGQCWVRLEGSHPLQLRAGDVVTLPQGDAHWIGSAVAQAAVGLEHVVELRMPELARVRYGGAGERALIVCGWFAYEQDLQCPLIGALPRMFATAVGSRPAGLWLEQSVRYALQEAASGHPGSAAIAARLAEVMFLEALRGHLEALAPNECGWLAGLGDPLVVRCLAAMHAAPTRDWTLADLATEAHASRSVLAARFSGLLGVPPMLYLKRLRLAQAARQLRGGHSSLAHVAGAVGYRSEAAFSRAFKREFGVAPGGWRRAGTA